MDQNNLTKDELEFISHVLSLSCVKNFHMDFKLPYIKRLEKKTEKLAKGLK